MCKSGPWAMLTVAKEAAFYHGLNDILLGKSSAPIQTIQTPPQPTPTPKQPKQREIES